MVAKLHYFNGAGIAESVRVMYVLSGTEFEDIRFTHEEWVEQKKKSPSGMAPWLEVGDEKGTVIVESTAISAYVAKITKMIPECPVEAAKVMAISFFQSNVFQALRPLRDMSDEDRKTKGPALIDEKLEPLFKTWEALLKTYQPEGQKPGYALGDKFTMADTFIYATIFGCLGNNPLGVSYSKIKTLAPTLYAIYENVASQEPVKKYIAKLSQ